MACPLHPPSRSSTRAIHKLSSYILATPTYPRSRAPFSRIYPRTSHLCLFVDAVDHARPSHPSFQSHSSHSFQPRLLPPKIPRARVIRPIARRVQTMPLAGRFVPQLARRWPHLPGAAAAHVAPRVAATTQSTITTVTDRAVGIPRLVPGRVRTPHNRLPPHGLRWRSQTWASSARRRLPRLIRKWAPSRVTTLGDRSNPIQTLRLLTLTCSPKSSLAAQNAQGLASRSSQRLGPLRLSGVFRLSLSPPHSHRNSICSINRWA